MPESTAMLGGIEVYVRLVWLFVFIITILMLLLCYLYLTAKRATEREHKSFAFSNLAIEGMETERRRIFRELHDMVLPQIRDQTVSDLIRTICMELTPPDFSRLSLKNSLVDACNKFSKRTGIECVCSIEEELDFSPIETENQLHLYRMVQEAFTNITKHSMATKVTLVARNFQRGQSSNILICVSDDGVGIGDSSGHGLGMSIMRQRAAILGARLDFINESGNGLMVRIEISRANMRAPE